MTDILQRLGKDTWFWVGVVALFAALAWSMQRNRTPVPLPWLDACMDATNKALSVERRLILRVKLDCGYAGDDLNEDNPCVQRVPAQDFYGACHSPLDCQSQKLRNIRGKYPSVRRAQAQARREAKAERKRKQKAHKKAVKDWEEGRTAVVKMEPPSDFDLLMSLPFEDHFTLNRTGLEKLKEKFQSESPESDAGKALTAAQTCGSEILS